MCTAITFKTDDFYFGRNLDLEYHYNETVTIMPRNYRLKFRKVKNTYKHFAVIGMAMVVDNYPLYYDAVNEKGLCAAALNFPHNACYHSIRCDKENVAPFELIAYVLAKCKNIEETQKLLESINVAEIPFSENFPLTPLHWIFADRERSITVEPTKDGLKIYNNPVGVLTNNPPFDIQLFTLNNYLSLTALEPKNSFSEKVDLKTYSRGMGALGLPGDLSSNSRFIRACFVKLNSVCAKDEISSVNQFFHILGAVEQQRGCVKLGENYEITVYSSCCNADKGIYYYSTYENRAITAVNMQKEDLDSKDLIVCELKTSKPLISE